MIAVGIIGYGFSGPNIAHCVTRTEGCELLAVSDASSAALQVAGELNPAVKLTSDGRDIVADPDIDAVIVSTPLETHFEIALSALRNGKHVLVDKPIASTSDEAALLIQEAAHRKRVLMVDHSYIYDPAIRKIKEVISNGEIGVIYAYDSKRMEIAQINNRLDAIWGISIYDLSILDYLIPANPVLVSANAPRGPQFESECVVHISICLDNGTMSNMSANQLAPIRTHRTTITGSRRFVIYDDLKPADKLKIYEVVPETGHCHSATCDQHAAQQTGNMQSPILARTNALYAEIQHFADCIMRGVHPLSSGLSGLRVVQILEAATLSMRRNGQPIELRQSKATA